MLRQWYQSKIIIIIKIYFDGLNKVGDFLFTNTFFVKLMTQFSYSKIMTMI